MNKKKLIDIFNIDKPNICFVGDIHGEFNSLQGLMKKTNFKDTAYIVCGDIGFGFNKKEYYSKIFNKLTKTASKLNCEFIFIRGNHDCLSKDTRVFTKRGFLHYNELTLDDEILSFNVNNEMSEWHSIDDIIVRNSEEIYEQKGQSLHIECTSNHRHIVKYDDKYDYIKTTEFKTYGLSKRCYIIHGAKINQNDYDIKDDEIRIVAWLMTDGYVDNKKYSYYCISQCKEKYIQEIKDCLERLKVNYTCSVRKRNNKGAIIKGKKVKKAKAENIFRLHAEFSKKMQIYLNDKNILPSWVYELSYRQLKIFTDTLLKANGTCLRQKGNYMLFGKYNSLLSFQPLFSMCGYRTSLLKDCRGDYRLNICENNLSKIMINNKKFVKKEYNDKVFCLTTKLSNFLVELNGKVYFTGNCPKFFDKRLINRKCFKTIPDYSVLQTPTHNILCIGGAISIDRTYRQLVLKENALKYSIYHGCTTNEAEKLCQQVYWEDEPCYYDEEKLSQLKLNNINIDIVCTHTCPSFTKPFGKENIGYWLSKDENLERDIDNEREVMDKVYNKLKTDGHSLDMWFYGHFHYHNVQFVDNTKFVMLDMYRNGNYDIYDVFNTRETIYD